MKDFSKLLREFEAHRRAGFDGGNKLVSVCDEKLREDFLSAFPKRKYSADKWKQAPNQKQIIADHNAAIQAYSEKFHAEERELDAALCALADVTAPERTEGLNLVHTASAHSYHTQGYGATRYAEAEAQRWEDTARRHGLTVEVRDGDREFCVYANTTQDGWELVRRKPGLSLKEWLKSCWKRGTNPRVFNPYLPPGLEESLGIDYFGNDIAQQGTVPAHANPDKRRPYKIHAPEPDRISVLDTHVFTGAESHQQGPLTI